MKTALLAASVFYLAAQSVDSPRRSPTAIAFVNVNVIRMDRERVEPAQTVVVRGDSIIEIGEAAVLRPPDDALVVEGGGRYLLPGLCDSHVHLGSDMPWAPTRPDFGDAALYLAHGVTAVVNLRGTPAQLEWKRQIEAGELLGPTIYTAGEFVNEPRVVTTDEVRREVLQQARDGYDVIKFHEIWNPDGTLATRQGLARDGYLALFDAARETGRPVVGHVPHHLGLDTLLASSSGAVAHIGELNRLHFVLGVRTLLATAIAALVLFVTVAIWSASALLARARGGRLHAASRARVLFASALVAMFALFVGGFVVGPGGPFHASLAARLGAGVVALAFVLLAGWAIVVGVREIRDRDASARSKWSLGLAATGSATLLVLVCLGWLPFLWRSSDHGMAHLADRFRDAGIAVQTTLVVYDVSGADGANRVLRDPSFTFLAPRVRTLWTQLAERGAPAGGAVPPRLPEFIGRLTGIFHRRGVELLAGTDAMGLPMIIPGRSLIRELELLNRSGLSPYEVIRTATVNPAKFLGRDREFGTLAPGRRADLMLLDRNPLESLSALDRPAGVMVRGRWLPRDRLDEMLSALR
jgi:hypothetical protein